VYLSGVRGNIVTRDNADEGLEIITSTKKKEQRAEIRDHYYPWPYCGGLAPVFLIPST
jgi:hypothetical protein